MWSVSVIFVYSFLKLCAHLKDVISQQIRFGIELFSEGSIPSFHTTIPLRPSRWQNKERYAQISTSFLKVLHKLRAPIYLYGLNGER